MCRRQIAGWFGARAYKIIYLLISFTILLEYGHIYDQGSEGIYDRSKEGL